ncbi:MAG: hypothetical protein AVDCRST_MAG88-4352, partial [uncultured Thermomicrobiales bacterium]
PPGDDPLLPGPALHGAGRCRRSHQGL